ncbi:MAG: glycosyltransferase [Actinobacteria bacterium]|nr:glycosyltransferase [Actinomycetota bacterium]
MRIAIMGIRGIPACYGGFETFAEELALRLVNKGHDITVYGRSNVINYKDKYYKGVRIIILPTISHKYLDTVIHTLVCVLHSLFNRYDVILICNAANSIFSFIPRIVGQKVVVNVDGIERKRKKWNVLGKAWYLFGEFFSVLFPNRIVTDAKVIQEYYKRRYHKSSVFIPYGAHITKISSTNILDRLGVEPNEYFLYVSRLEPENNAHIVIKAFEQVKTNKKLVVVGDAPYAKDYIKRLKETRDPRIIFTGYVYGEGYKELQGHAYCYVHATEVGGTHPALVEAMGFGNCVIVNGTPENVEVIGDCGLVYRKNDIDDLISKMNYVISNPSVVKSLGEKARERVRKHYSWDAITDKYESLFLSLLQKG